MPFRHITHSDQKVIYFCHLIALFCLFYLSIAHASLPVKARYVQVILPGDGRILSLAEVEVYSGGKLISLEGQARQVSTASGGDASKAIDGNTSGNFFENSVTHTRIGSFVWWELDLGSQQVITKIAIYNRTDCCSERINPARILLLSDSKEVVWEGSIVSNAPRYVFHIVQKERNQPKISPNLLRNATFRKCTNPRIPDYWGLHPAAATRFRNLHRQYYVDNDVKSPVAGTNVLKIHNSEENFRHTMLIPSRLFADLPDGYYTFSVFAKSDRPGTELRVAPAWAAGKEIARKLSTKWKRYSFTFKLPVAGNTALQPVLRFPKKGIYFIAAPQLEYGTAPTTFQPSYKRVSIKRSTKLRDTPLVQERKVPRLTSSLLVNERPFYIIGIVAQGAMPDWYLDEIREYGINTIFYYRLPNNQSLFNRERVSEIESLLLSAAKHDLKVIVGLALAGAKPANWRGVVSAFSKLVKRLKKYPVVIGWYPVDEPATSTWRDNELVEIYGILKKLDRHRLVFVNWSYDAVPKKVGRQPRGTLACTDVYSVSYYPFAGRRHSLLSYTETMLRALKTARLTKKPFHSWLQLYGCMDAWREPTGIELRYMAYLNFVYGGMISYWSTKPNSAGTWQSVKRINCEAKILADSLFLNPGAHEVVQPVEDKNFIYSAWKVGKKIFLIVVHTETVDREFKCDVSNLLKNIPFSSFRVRSLFERRYITLSNNCIEDVFPPLGTKVYELNSR